MKKDPHASVHTDFRLTEREGNADPAGLRKALRSAYDVPSDTFVTGDRPLLLTRLATSAKRP